MSNYIYYEHLEDYERQVQKAKAYDAFKEWVEDQMTPKTDAWGDTGFAYMLRCDVIMEKLKEFEEGGDV